MLSWNDRLGRAVLGRSSFEDGRKVVHLEKKACMENKFTMFYPQIFIFKSDFTDK